MSLRVRVLVSVLALASVGMIALGAITYVEQRSFLEGRANQQAKLAIPILSDALDRKSKSDKDDTANRDATSTPAANRDATSTSAAGKGKPLGPAIEPNLPPGTYGQRREASGKIVTHVFPTYGQAQPAAPKLPRHVPTRKLFTVGSVGSSGLDYRVYATRAPDDGDLTIAAIPLDDVDQTLHQLLLVEGLVIAAVLIALGLTASFVVRIGLRPLDRIEATAGKIAAGDLTRRISPETPSTEVGRLGIALNKMLNRLEQAFAARKASEDRLRQFLADASHELRTPLASIRGYAELFRIGAANDPESAERAMRRIEEESKRMGILVEDMLTLARLDEAPARPREPVDLEQLAQDAISDAKAREPERKIELRHGKRAQVVEGDPLQLRQVLTNLLGNALLHTPPATEIEVSLDGDESHASLTVRDHGPGLPNGSEQSLFERFWRAEGGRERGRAGAGLGLAIVREIVEAHHGTVTASNAPTGGAKFVVTLPRHEGSQSSPSSAPQQACTDAIETECQAQPPSCA